MISESLDPATTSAAILIPNLAMIPLFETWDTMGNRLGRIPFRRRPWLLR